MVILPQVIFEGMLSTVLGLLYALYHLLYYSSPPLICGGTLQDPGECPKPQAVLYILCFFYTYILMIKHNL